MPETHLPLASHAWGECRLLRDAVGFVGSQSPTSGSRSAQSPASTSKVPEIEVLVDEGNWILPFLPPPPPMDRWGGVSVSVAGSVL